MSDQPTDSSVLGSRVGGPGGYRNKNDGFTNKRVRGFHNPLFSFVPRSRLRCCIFVVCALLSVFAKTRTGSCSVVPGSLFPSSCSASKLARFVVSTTAPCPGKAPELAHIENECTA